MSKSNEICLDLTYFVEGQGPGQLASSSHTLLGCKTIFYFFLFEREREEERERERERRERFVVHHLFMHSLVDSWMCPDRGSNSQPWRIRRMLSPTEMSGQGSPLLLCYLNETSLSQFTKSPFTSSTWTNNAPLKHQASCFLSYSPSPLQLFVKCVMWTLRSLKKDV